MHREVKERAQRHIAASKWYGQDVNPGHLNPSLWSVTLINSAPNPVLMVSHPAAFSLCPEAGYICLGFSSC